MRHNSRFAAPLLSLVWTVVLASAAFAADPGSDVNDIPEARFANQVSDQKRGSILIYNLYSSNATAPATQNTRFNITNTNAMEPAFVHLYFVDGSSCSVADNFICLTPNQTASFLASEIDPGVTGYAMAVAVDGVDGIPVAFDYLIGDAYVKLASGHFANLGAEAVGVSILPLLVFPVPGSGGSLVRLEFDGLCYNRLPRVLAVDNIPSRADGNDTLLVINRVGGNYASAAGAIGNVFGLLYDDAENAFSFTFNSGACQFRSSLSDSFPRSVPRLESVIPAGRSGWMKFWTTEAANNTSFGGRAAENRSVFGAVLNANPNAASTGFAGGRNLHHLSYNDFVSLAVPVFAPSC